MATRASQRLRALALYKELHRLGRDYDPSSVNGCSLSWHPFDIIYSYDFHGKLRKLFQSQFFFQTRSALRASHHVDPITSRHTDNRNLMDETEIERALAFGEYIKNGTSCAARRTAA